MRFRRARCLTCYWHEGAFVVHPYAGGAPVSLHPAAAEILSAFEDWATAAEATKLLDHLAPETVDEAVDAFAHGGVLLAEGSAEAGRDEDIARDWSAWAPEAPFLHFATQNDYLDTEVNTEDADRVPDAAQLPPLFTAYPDAMRLPLPRRPADLRASYDHVLYSRRTHRDFTREPVELETLAALLSTVFGPVDFVDSGHGPLYRRTSPSGGARQELDAYVGILNVTGLAPGWYHYNGLQHCLELRADGLTSAEAAHLCADQEWAGHAAFLVVLVARMERLSVKYHTPRCYRVCLLNAGHLGQTFALTATALGLGPAQTGAFNDAPLAERCGLDNAGHVPVYALAAGHPHSRPHNAPTPVTMTAFRSTVLDA
ncbi:SagB/ThcOx family dehydrogenase [Streptomyces gilvosporeus]|uniref:Nitroreductase n=1 Tax=Streptomyces gilvosporeus TaxID=553510 RepID=A0A1V0TTN4_9ACTN|nr:SagB/ThcOx family dehydrogenase [Streptomyces gilvosporeus]ARF56243.1 nitroreductase [Streptomyces gilvosporeus]